MACWWVHLALARRLGAPRGAGSRPASGESDRTEADAAPATPPPAHRLPGSPPRLLLLPAPACLPPVQPPVYPWTGPPGLTGRQASRIPRFRETGALACTGPEPEEGRHAVCDTPTWFARPVNLCAGFRFPVYVLCDGTKVMQGVTFVLSALPLGAPTRPPWYRRPPSPLQ